MNRIFKVIYSKTKHTYVVVSELAKSHVRSKNGGGVTSGRLLPGVLLAALLLTGAGSASYAQGITIGGRDNTARGEYSVTTAGEGNQATGDYSAVTGGSYNIASGKYSTVIGGGDSPNGGTDFFNKTENEAKADSSTIIGGYGNTTEHDFPVYSPRFDGGSTNLSADHSTIVGGHNNRAIGGDSFIAGGNGNTAYGYGSSVYGGSYNFASAYSMIVGGIGNLTGAPNSYSLFGYFNQVANYQALAIGGQYERVIGEYSIGIGGGSTGREAENATAIGNHSVVTTKNGLALGYQSTTNAEGTISFGHEKGDVSGYDSKLKPDVDGYSPDDFENYAVDLDSGKDNTGKVYTPTTYNEAYYNRLVKVADGQDAHDAVVVEQLKTLAAASDASNIGKNLTKVPVKDAGNIEYEKSGAMKLQDATAEDKTTNAESWGTAIGTGKVEKDDKQLVTGGTVYKALNGGLTKIVIGTPGEPGKDGAPGTIGLVGPAGTNGKDGAVDITIQKGKDDDAKGIKGANGVDGKDGITRIVYTDAAGDNQAATMEDGMKFAGDDGQTSADKVIAKKLNNTIDIIGGADSKKLTDKNIGVNNVGGKLKIQLAQNLTGITSIGNQKTTGEGKDATTTGAKITLDDNDKNISVNGGSIKEVASNLKDGKLIDGSANNAASISDVQTLVQQGVDNGYTNGDGITIQKDSTSGKNVISVNKGDGLKFNDSGELVVNTGDGLEIAGGAVKIKAADNNFKISSNGIGLNDIVTIGTNKNTQVTIDGTKGEISGLSNTTWGKPADYSNSTKAATESQVAQAISAAIDQAGQNDVDTHVEAGTYAVGTITTDDGKTEQGVSLAIVDKSGKTTNTKVVITDVAKASDVGDVSKLADGVKNADGSTTTVVNAINNVNTKIGDQKYSTSNTSGSNKYVNDGDSITSAIGKLDGAVQNAAEQAGKHSIVSVAEGEKNISVKNIAKEGEAANYQISLNKDLNVTSVTATTVTTDTLNANSATIGGDKGITIKDNTVSGLKDTEIKEGSTNAVNGNTIWKELRPTDDGSYIKKDNTTAQNLVSLDTQVKKTADLINSDGSTIKIGGSDKATKIDISGKDSGGSTTARIITGVQTDAQDATSAANVGYVNDVAAANTQQIYREMHSAYGHLNNNINKAAAGSNALAALHPLDHDPAGL